MVNVYENYMEFFETYYMEEDEINSHILRILLCKAIAHCGKYINHITSV